MAQVTVKQLYMTQVIEKTISMAQMTVKAIRHDTSSCENNYI